MGTYKTSTIRLYQATSTSNWELLPHKLFIVDDIESYLATKTFNTYTLVQYQKPTLELSIVLDLSQTYAEPLNSGFKYARIENSDDTGHYYYYFVKSIDWRAKSAVRFNLVMDVLNTFKEGTHYSFKDSTKISREHKDRFVLLNSKVLVFTDCYLNDYSGSITNQLCEVYDESNNLICKGTVTDNDLHGFTLTLTNDYDGREIKDLIDSIKDQNDLTFKYTVSSWSNYTIGEITLGDGRIWRTIDYIPENINPILQCGDAEGTKVEFTNTNLRDDWYLLYRNENDPTDSLVNPVECYLIPKTTTVISTGGLTSGQITPATLESGKLYYFPIYSRNIVDSFVDIPAYNQSISLSNGVTFSGHDFTDEVSYLVVAKSENGLLNVLYNKYVYDGNGGFTVSSQVIYGMIAHLTINQSPTYYNASSTTGLTVIEIYSDYLSTLDRKTFTTSQTGESVDSIDELDRTQAKNIKLIKLPYVPYQFTVSGGRIDISNSDWNLEVINQPNANTVDFNALKLNDLNTELKSEWPNYTCRPNSNLYVDTFTNINPQNTDLRKGASYESKLFNSEFYRPTFYYDSFQFVVQLEKCDLSWYAADISRTSQFKIIFNVTRTINSKFMFTFADYHIKNGGENYAKFMPIARNNEEVLYNVPYINYIRTGYNYDIKQKNRSNISNWLSVAGSGVGLAASLVLPSAPLKALGVVTSLISMAMTVKNAVVTTMNNQESIDRKLKEAEMQTASVSGSDDVDLMSVYAENRLKYLVYEPNDIMKTMLYNLFFFAGYNSQRMGLPSHNTRLNFDYLECDAVINKIANIPDDCLSELINSFKNGVTYIHKTTRTTDKWDFEQKYENWEKSLGVE